MVENFDQLKHQVIPGAEIEIVGYWSPRYIGQVRRITKVDLGCFYTAIPGHPEHWISQENGGQGDSFWWRTDSFWEFKDGICSLSLSVPPELRRKKRRSPFYAGPSCLPSDASWTA